MDGLFAATGSSEVARVKRGYSGKVPGLRVIIVNDVAIAFFEAGVEKGDCSRKTVEDQGAQWWGCCRNHCTVQERCSRELPEKIQKFMKRQGFLLGKYRSESHGSQG